MTIIHIVHFGFSSTVSESEKKDIASRFLGLKQSCTLQDKDGKGDRYIVDLQGGVNNSPEGMTNGLEVSPHKPSSSHGDLLLSSSHLSDVGTRGIQS
jgi:hypothetical protein